MEIYSVVFVDEGSPKPHIFRDKKGAYEFFRDFLLDSESGGWWDANGAIDFDHLLKDLDDWYFNDNESDQFVCWADEDGIERFIFRHTI